MIDYANEDLDLEEFYADLEEEEEKKLKYNFSLW